MEETTKILEGIEVISPVDIEKRSFEIIEELMGDNDFPPLHSPIIKRVIHTTADFEFLHLLKISPNGAERGINALREGCSIVTDTKMAWWGINKKLLSTKGGEAVCHMDDGEIAREAAERGITRAIVSMEKAALNPANRIFAVGNAPTALIRLCQLIKEGKIEPDLVIGVPVGFVNVVESKELLKKAGVPFIITEGRKGGSTIAAAIVNALLKLAFEVG